MTDYAELFEDHTFDPATFDPLAFDPDLKAAADISASGYTFLLYGQAGSGKSTMIGTFPKPILFFNPVTENSIRTLRRDPRVYYWDITGLDMIVDKINVIEESLAQGTFQFKTIAVDSLSFVVDMLLGERRRKQEQHGRGLAQADWGIVANTVMEIIQRINGWPGCQKVWTASVDTEKDDLTGDIEGYPKMFKSLQRSVWNIMDVVLYLEAGRAPNGKPSWNAYTARHRYYSARVRGAPVPGKIEPTFDAVMKLLEKPLYGPSGPETVEGLEAAEAEAAVQSFADGQPNGQAAPVDEGK
jgi:hypothetical protein